MAEWKTTDGQTILMWIKIEKREKQEVIGKTGENIENNAIWTLQTIMELSSSDVVLGCSIPPKAPVDLLLL